MSKGDPVDRGGISTKATATARRVTVDAIERDLAQLWHSVVESGEMPPVRASVLNLVVYADADAASRALAVLATLPGCHMSRVLVLIPSRGGQGQISADLAAYCDRIGVDGRRVCHEQVTLRFGNDAVELLPGLVRPLLLPDLPVVLWLAGRGSLEHMALGWLREIADRIIVDSAVYGAAETPLGGVEHLVADPGRTAALGDLNWGRVSPWRRLIAQAFEPATLRPYAHRLDEVTIAYQSDGAIPPAGQVWLLAGWMLARLGWQPTSASQAEPLVWDLAHPNHSKSVRLSFAANRACATDPGHIGIVTLQARAGDHTVLFQISRSTDRMCAVSTVTIDGVQQRQTVAHLGVTDDANLLAEELNRDGRDHAYEAAVAHAIRLYHHLRGNR